MYKYIWITLMTSLFWGSAQAMESRLTACFSDLDDKSLTIVHDKKSGDKKEGEEEEEPDCE